MNLLLIIFYGALILLLPAGIVAALCFMFKNELKAVMLARASRNKDFSCQRCTDCCNKLVIVTEEEIKRIVEHTGLAEAEFIERKMNLPCLLRTPEGLCTFLSVTQNSSGDPISSCRIYPARPAICRRYPYLKYMGVNGIDPRCRSTRKTQNQETCRSWTQNDK